MVSSITARLNEFNAAERISAFAAGDNKECCEVIHFTRSTGVRIRPAVSALKKLLEGVQRFGSASRRGPEFQLELHGLSDYTLELDVS